MVLVPGVSCLGEELLPNQLGMVQSTCHLDTLERRDDRAALHGINSLPKYEEENGQTELGFLVSLNNESHEG